MNFKKTWKRFFSLSRASGGFTLVELIVVIAILAILAGVGVPAYSGYVEKANISADQQLAREVSNALTLYYYDNYTDSPSGYVLLTVNGAKADENVGANAMEAVFGEKWEDVVLKHSGWAADGVLGPAMSSEVAEAITNSSFVAGDSSVDELLGTVADLTDSAFSFISKKISNPATLYSAMVGNFSNSDAEFKDMCAKYGIPLNETGDAFVIGSTEAEKEDFQAKLSNMMVFAAAQNFTDAAENGADATTAANLMLMYGGYTAAVNSEYATEETKAAYEAMNATFKEAASLDAVMDAMDAFSSNEAVADMMANYESDETGVAANDSIALANILKAVNAASGQVGVGDMSNRNLFTDSTVTDHFNAFLNAAGAVSGENFPAANAGDILVYLDASGVVLSSADDLLAQ